MVKVKQAQEARVKQFLFQNVQHNEIFEISKMFKIYCWIVELTYPIQKANPCSLLDRLFYSVVPFLGKFGQKAQNGQFKLKFGT